MPRLLFLFAIAIPLLPQSYVFTKIADANTQRPDGAGAFFPDASSIPSYDGQWVVFREYGPKNDASLQAIWSFNTFDGTFHKLADLKTPAPGANAGNFSDLQLLDAYPIVRNGIVVFLGRDSDPNRPALSCGLYSIPAAGGAIAKIADYKTPVPSGGTLNIVFNQGGFDFDGSTVVFQAFSSNNTVNGVYSAKPDGSALAMVADSLHPFKPATPLPLLQQIQGFRGPLVSGSNVAINGTTGLDPSTGYNGLYLGTAGGNGVLSEQLNALQQLPGNSDANFHTRFDYPSFSFDGNLVAFVADDSNTLTYNGLYTTTLDSHTISKIADINSTLPGLGPLGTPSNGISGRISVSQGRVLFLGANNSNPPGYPVNTALFLWQNNAITRILGTADPLDGGNVYYLLPPHPRGLFGSTFAFNACCNAVYLATPASSSISIVAVTNAASGAAGSIAPGEIVTLYGTGLAGVRVLFNGYPAPIIYSSASQTSAVAPFELAGQTNAQIEATSNGAVSAPLTIPITNTLPGIFPVILNADNSVNTPDNPTAAGTIIVSYASGLGPISGSTLRYPATVTIGGQPADILYQGSAPGAITGLYQINVRIPAGLPSGNAAVVLTSDNRQSQPNVTVSVN